MNNSRAALPVRAVLATLIVLGPWLLGGAPAAAAADPGEARDAVVVTGTGEVFGEPDTLAANFAVETSAPTVGQALAGASAAATRMRDALVRAGVVKADLQTSDATVASTVDEHKKVTAYTASQGLVATIRDLPRAGAIMSEAIAAGGDAARLHGVSFTIEDSATLLDEARKKAFADARGKAELYAREAGRSLGRVVRVSEDNPGYQASAAHYSLASGAADAAVPIEPGRQRLAVTVTVEWSFAQV